LAIEQQWHDGDTVAGNDRISLVELKGLTKVYMEGDTERVVLRGVDATIGRGEFVAVVGRSGSGKSTLLNLLSGIDDPTAGEVIVDGTPVTRLAEPERTLFRRRRVGFIFQFFNLISTLTVEENLWLPLELVGRGGRDARAETTALLAEVGLADRRRAFPDRLSGGEQQRVAVARALVHDPDLILADEPTGNLDTASAQAVLGLLARLSGERKKTVIAATHSAELACVADRILLLRDGRLVEE
jgi:putative ABC transport system ATP-binding protein